MTASEEINRQVRIDWALARRNPAAGSSLNPRAAVVPSTFLPRDRLRLVAAVQSPQLLARRRPGTVACQMEAVWQLLAFRQLSDFSRPYQARANRAVAPRQATEESSQDIESRTRDSRLRQ